VTAGEATCCTLPVPRATGDGGAYTTLDDMDRFWTALFRGTDPARRDRSSTAMVMPRHDVPENKGTP